MSWPESSKPLIPRQARPVALFAPRRPFTPSGAARWLALLGLLAGLGYAPAARADASGNADLVVAAFKGDRTAVRTLLAHGASLDARDSNGYTALHWAAYRGDAKLVGLLLQAGAAVDAVDKQGNTPLMLAAWNGHVTVVHALLAKGANRDLQTPAGFRALDFARRHKHVAVMRELASLAIVFHPGTGHRYVPVPIPVQKLVLPAPKHWATPKPIVIPIPEESTAPTEFATPEPTPIPTPEPTVVPPDIAAPTETPEPHPGNMLTVVGGVHFSKIDFPIVGVHYRRTIIEPVALQLGYELGGYNQAVGTGSLDYNYSRFHAALVTTGWVYVGLGVTHVVLGSIYSQGYNPSATAYEAIGGANVPLGRFNLNAEGRFGYDGPSTALLGFGVGF